MACLDPGSHCLTIKNIDGACWSPESKGILNKHLRDYSGRTISAHRYIGGPVDRNLLWKWGYNIQNASGGYDFKAWLGFVTGLKSLANDETRWTCAELPYWMFHGNGYKLTPNDEAFIYPRFSDLTRCLRRYLEGGFNKKRQRPEHATNMIRTPTHCTLQ